MCAKGASNLAGAPGSGFAASIRLTRALILGRRVGGRTWGGRTAWSSTRRIGSAATGRCPESRSQEAGAIWPRPWQAGGALLRPWGKDASFDASEPHIVALESQGSPPAAARRRREWSDAPPSATSQGKGPRRTPQAYSRRREGALLACFMPGMPTATPTVGRTQR
jgi:hypothetical protein